MAQIGQDAPSPASVSVEDAPASVSAEDAPASVSVEDAESVGERESTPEGFPPIYTLRQGVRIPGKQAPTTAIDQDKSGDYKPEPANACKSRAGRAKRKYRSSESLSELAPQRKKADIEQGSGNKSPKSKTTSNKHENSLNSEIAYRPPKDGGDVRPHQDEASTSFTESAPDDSKARGCKPCLEFAVPCSLLEQESRYPCAVCVLVGRDCELITEPLLKQTCLNCEKNEIPCSFKIEPERRGPCNSCIASSTRCVAGPSREKYLSGPPRIVRQRNQAASSPKDRSHETQAIENANTKDNPRVRKKASNGVVQLITTCYAHPIKFNYEPPNPSEPCHWCEDLLYGLVGLGRIEVEVISFRDGRGYTETENGHTHAGQRPTRMCTKCTLARLTSAACIYHDMKPIPGVNPEAFTPASFAHYLVPGMTEHAPFEWCHVCLTPASFRCVKRQEPHPLSSDPGVGCGLLLCKRCAGHLMIRFQGVLGRLIDGLKNLNKTSELRADADFLHPKGELLQRFKEAGGLW